jgi:hypothetical protein
MNGEAIKELSERLSKPIDIGGFVCTPPTWTISDPIALVKAGPIAVPLGVATLGAVRDYLAANKDALDLSRLVVHVLSPTQVTVLGPLDGRARSREAYVTAKSADLTENWLGRFWTLEEFLIGLQVRFVPADDRTRVLTVMSNVKHESVKTALDDGVTQIVQARAGVALVSDVVVPNPVVLCAYRTFRDVVQPSSLFVLRVKSGHAGELPEAGLFEADGGAWRLTAIEQIRVWLSEALPAGVAVLA